MIDPSKISVVIPVHNRKGFTLACLKSLYDQSVTGFQVVVVDDGSTDGTAEVISREFPAVAVIRGDGSLWWSASMNLGVRYALQRNARYIVSLNNDLEVDYDYLKKMMEWAVRKPQALLGSYGFDITTRTPNYGGERMEWKMRRMINLLDSIPEDQRHGLYEVTHFPGRGLWIPSVVFEKIGFFDAKSLPHYGGDDDFTLRAKENGFEIYCNYDARLYSHITASGDADNRKNFCVKNYLNHLFGIKGGGNLKNFTVITFRHCPTRNIWFYWPYGIVARMGGYLLDWCSERRRVR